MGATAPTRLRYLRWNARHVVQPTLIAILAAALVPLTVAYVVAGDSLTSDWVGNTLTAALVVIVVACTRVAVVVRVQQTADGILVVNPWARALVTADEIEKVDVVPALLLPPIACLVLSSTDGAAGRRVKVIGVPADRAADLEHFLQNAQT